MAFSSGGGGVARGWWTGVKGWLRTPRPFQCLPPSRRSHSQILRSQIQISEPLSLGHTSLSRTHSSGQAILQQHKHGGLFPQQLHRFLPFVGRKLELGQGTSSPLGKRVDCVRPFSEWIRLAPSQLGVVSVMLQSK